MRGEKRDQSQARELQPEPSLRLAAQMQSLSRLHRGLAHDLKSPLNAMVLNLELLKRSILSPQQDGGEGEEHETRQPAVREKQQRWVSTIERELLRLRDGLDLVMAQLAVPNGDAESFDLRGLVAELEALLGPQARQRRISLRSVTPGSGAAMVSARPAALRQALLAVATQLLEGLSEGAELTLGLEPDGHQVALQLAFTGHQGRSNGAGSEAGAGELESLPVEWARAVAQEHGGNANWSTSASGDTLFVLTLPTR